MLLDSECTEASFSPNSTYSLCSQLGQVPRFPDLAIFVSIHNDNNDDTTDYFTPCACAWGKNERACTKRMYTGKNLKKHKEVDLTYSGRSRGGSMESPFGLDLVLGNIDARQNGTLLPGSCFCGSP